MRYCNECGWSEEHPNDGMFYCPICDTEQYFSSDAEWDDWLQQVNQK